MEYHDGNASASAGDTDDIRTLEELGFFGFTSFDQVNQFITGNTLDIDVLVIKDAPADSITVFGADFHTQFYAYWIAQGNKLYFPAKYHAEMRKIGAIYDENDARLLGKPTFTLDKAELDIMRNAASLLGPFPNDDGAGVQETAVAQQPTDPQLLDLDFDTPMDFTSMDLDAPIDFDTPMQDNLDIPMQDNFDFAPQETQATASEQYDDLDTLLSLSTSTNSPSVSDYSQDQESPIPTFATPVNFAGASNESQNGELLAPTFDTPANQPGALDGSQALFYVQPAPIASLDVRNIYDGSEALFAVQPTTEFPVQTFPVDFPTADNAFQNTFQVTLASESASPPHTPAPPSEALPVREARAVREAREACEAREARSRSGSPSDSGTITRLNGTLSKQALEELLATGLYQAMYWQTRDQQGDVHRCQPSQGYRRILTEMHARGEIQAIPTVDSDLMANVVYSHAPPPSVDVRLLGDVYLTIVEILAFFPAHHTRWIDVIHRLHGGRWSTRDPSKKIYSARGFIIVSGKRSHKTLVDRESDRVCRHQTILKLKDLAPAPYIDLTCQHWTHPKQTPWGQKEAAKDGHDLIDYYVSDLADGFPRALFPRDEDAGVLTAVVAYVLDNPNDNECKQLKLSGVSAFAKAKRLFWTPDEAGLSTEVDQHADTRARDRFILAGV